MTDPGNRNEWHIMAGWELTEKDEERYPLYAICPASHDSTDGHVDLGDYPTREDVDDAINEHIERWHS